MSAVSVMSSREKPTAEQLRKLYYEAEANGASTVELDKAFGKSRWFISLQCPAFSEFRHEYQDTLNRHYMHIEDQRWGVRVPHGSAVPFPDISDELELVRRGTAEVTRLRVEMTENPAKGRRATRTLVCTRI